MKTYKKPVSVNLNITSTNSAPFAKGFSKGIFGIRPHETVKTKTLTGLKNM